MAVFSSERLDTLLGNGLIRRKPIHNSIVSASIEVKMDIHEKLLESWKSLPHHSGKGFIKDGIIDLSLWNEARIKVLFLLKEAYFEPDDPYDNLPNLLRNKLSKHVVPKGWWNAAYWAYAAHHILVDVAPELPQSRQSCSESLLATAVVNVKKSSGKRNSNMEEIKQYAKDDRDLLKQQIDIINPDLVICGSTWEAVQHPDTPPFWPSARRLYDLVYEAEKKIFMHFWHPANRWPTELNYHAITALLRHPNVRQAIQNHQNQQSTR